MSTRYEQIANEDLEHLTALARENVRRLRIFASKKGRRQRERARDVQARHEARVRLDAISNAPLLTVTIGESILDQGQNVETGV